VHNRQGRSKSFFRRMSLRMPRANIDGMDTCRYCSPDGDFWSSLQKDCCSPGGSGRSSEQADGCGVSLCFSQVRRVGVVDGGEKRLIACPPSFPKVPKGSLREMPSALAGRIWLTQGRGRHIIPLRIPRFFADLIHPRIRKLFTLYS